MVVPDEYVPHFERTTGCCEGWVDFVTYMEQKVHVAIVLI